MTIDHTVPPSRAADLAPIRIDDVESSPDDGSESTAAAAIRVSGLYLRPSAGLPFRRDELRLDVDGRFPQMTVSGVVRTSLRRVHWIASLTPSAAATSVWSGPIWFKDGDALLLPQTSAEVRVLGGPFGVGRKAEVRFTGSGTDLVHEYRPAGPDFDTVEFEFDQTADANPAYSIDLHGHPNRPVDLPDETMTAQKVYQRAGFRVRTTTKGPLVPTVGAGTDARWSDTEMHDAMQAHWSRFADRAQWSLWVFNAALHEQGTSLGGVMFDDIGPNHRQGTAIFTESFIATPPAGDPDAAAAVARMRFWTMCHEMGHAFNLAHSWQKSLGAPVGSPWLPLQDAPEERSFMNYPFRVAGGPTAFFGDFEYRFSDQELLFLRHAPRAFVEMGNAEWFDHHGFEDANVSPEPTIGLVARLTRSSASLEFLEPAVIELKATNLTRTPMVVDQELLGDSRRLTIVVKRDNGTAKVWRPFATALREPVGQVLLPDESMYHSVLVGAGAGGWTIAEPGWYTIQAILRLDTGEDVVSSPLRLRVEPPATFEDERVSHDLFTDDVARTLSFDGSRELTDANDVLRGVADRLPDRRIATHAQVAVGSPMTRNGKILTYDNGQEGVSVVPARPQEARSLLESALLTDQDQAARTLGHIGFRERTEALAQWLVGEGQARDAHDVLAQLGDTLAERGVKPAVVAEIRAEAGRVGATANGGAKTQRKGGR